MRPPYGSPSSSPSLQKARSDPLGSNPGRGPRSEAEGETSIMRRTDPRFAAAWALAGLRSWPRRSARAGDWLPIGRGAGPPRRTRRWPRSSRPSAPRRRSTRTSSTSRGSPSATAQRQDPAAPSDVTTMRPAPRRPPGGPDLLPAPGVRTRRRGEVSPRGDLGLRRRADAHGRRRQLRQHPPGPLAAPAIVFPRTALPLAHYGVNFPLSIYLSGTEAIHAHLEYPPGLVDAGRRGRPSARSRRVSRARSSSTASAA